VGDTLTQAAGNSKSLVVERLENPCRYKTGPSSRKSPGGLPRRIFLCI
jgi:hypothetical protein